MPRSPNGDRPLSDREQLAKHFDDFTRGECRLDISFTRTMFDRFGARWTCSILIGVAAGPKRFNELIRLTPDISRKMLTQTLRTLERDGLVTRHVYPTKPPSVVYRLAPLGESMLEPLNALVAWSEDRKSVV